MANLNLVLLIGRLTRDPEAIVMGGSPAGARFGFAVNNRKKNQQGQYEDVPVWLNCECWNRGENKMGQRVLDTLKKGAQIHITGHLKYDEWDDKNGGGKRHDVKIVVDQFQYLDKKDENAPQQPRQQHAGRPQGGQQPQRGGYGGGNYDDGYGAPEDTGRGGYDPDNDIPF